MERAARSLAKLKLSGKISADEIALAAWPVAVGERIAAKARAVAVVRGNLIVEVEDAIWKKQLFSLRSQILRKVQDLVGADTVNDVEFRLAATRRPPQVSHALTSPDEADRILDRGMRIVYKQARKKAAG